MRRTALALLVTVLAPSLVACEEDETASEALPPPEPGEAVEAGGKWFGFVVDGKTGEKLNFFGEKNDADDNASADQIYVVADGEFRTAQPCLPGDASDENQISPAGCFQVEGLPLGVSMPVFVDREGYHSFAGTISIDPAALAPNAASSGSELEAPLLADEPSLYKNVRLFPVGNDYDYTLTATINGEGAADMTVRCVFDSAANAFDSVGGGEASNFLSPTNDFNPILEGTTNGDGSVTFDGKELTKGATYQCFADGSDPVTGSPVSHLGEVSFTVGVSAAVVAMPMGVAESKLIAIYNNFGDDTAAVGGMDGELTIVLNRPVELLAGSQDCLNAAVAVSLPSAEAPEEEPVVTTLVADEDDDDAESVTVSLDDDGRVLTIKPSYDTIDSADRDVRLSVRGIFLVPLDGQAIVYGLGTGASVGTTAGFTLSDVAATCGGVQAEPLVDGLTDEPMTDTAVLVGP